MFPKSLAGVLTSLADVHMATDPWGIGFRIPVLRIDHHDWIAWREKHVPQSRAATLLQQVTLEASLARTINRQIDAATAAAEEKAAARPGFRSPKKKTAAQREAAAIRDEPISSREILREAIGAVSPQELMGTLRVDLDALRPGIAQVLMSDKPMRPGGPPWTWHGITADDSDEPLPFTIESRLRLLGWRGVMVETSGGEIQFFADEAALSADLPMARKVEFSGDHRDADGNLIIVPDGQPYGPAPLGEAITNWLLEEAAKGALGATADLEEAEEDLGGTPGGASATSAD